MSPNVTLLKASDKIKGDALNGRLGDVEVDQNNRYYNSAVQRVAPKIEDALPIREAGFRIEVDADDRKKEPGLLVERIARANNGAEKGLLTNAAGLRKKAVFY